MTADPDYSAFEQMLAAIFGPEAAAKMLADLRASGADLSALTERISALGGGMDAGQLATMFTNAKSVFGSSSGPVNWSLARQIATRAITSDPPFSAAKGEEIRLALAAADLWLDPVVALGSQRMERQAWRRGQWLEGTAPGWKALGEATARQVTRAMQQALNQQLGKMGLESSPLGALGGGDSEAGGSEGAAGLMWSMASGMFGMQLGKVLGPMASEALGSTDIGFPLGGAQVAALVAENVAQFAAAADVPYDQVLGFLATREVAHQRLFAAAPWLRNHVVAAVERFCNEITIDTDAIEEAARGLETGEAGPENLLDANLSLFKPGLTDAQRTALGETETALAVIEGWVSAVTQRACLPYIPATIALGEMMRRRRAAGSPAEQLLANLIGLQLRPKRARSAQTLWEHITDRVGIDARDRLWAHAATMPGADELQDPDAFFDNRAAREEADSKIDDELRDLLEGSLGWSRGLTPAMDSEGDDTVAGQAPNTSQQTPGEAAQDRDTPPDEGEQSS